MKKILFTLFAAVAVFFLSFCISAQSGSAEGIAFETGTFDEALAKARDQNKLLFIDAYASWCGPCQRMASEVFTQKEVGDYFNATFVNWKFDVEQGDGIKLAQRYNVEAYPTFLIVDGNGALVGTMIGGSPADDFIRRVKLLVEKGTGVAR